MMTRRRGWRLSIVALALAALAAGPWLATRAAAAPVAETGVVQAGVDDFAFASMHADYTLGRADDGTSELRVVETFVAQFPDIDQNHGMRRIIPDSYLGTPLFPELISITDGDGRPREAESDTDDGAFAMTSRADDWVHGEQTYVFTYTLRNVTRHFSDTGVDEFYWDVNGTDWLQPFGEVTATLTAASDLAGALTGDAACYAGSEGATTTCPITVDVAAGRASASAGPLGPHQTMTVAVAFAAGTFRAFDSSYFASGWSWAQTGAGLVGVGALLAAVRARRRGLADAPGRPTIIAEYTPPQIDALESAVLLGLPTKAIPAEVLEQAVRGSIRIIEGPKRAFRGAALTAQLIDPSKADGDGLMLLQGLFPSGRPGEEYEFGRSDTRLSVTAQKILNAAAVELKSRGLRRDVRPGTRAVPILLGALGAGLVFVLGFGAMAAGVHPAGPAISMVVGVLLFIAVSILVWRQPLTEAGAEVRDHLAGLRMFIEWAEADRIRMLQSPLGAQRRAFDVDDPRQMLHLYESLLPYAVVFGQEKQWSAQLAVMYDGGSPGWYVGTSGFHAAAFAAGISSLSASASASTSGGSSGGGSAGGGGGGGGGGGV